MTAYRIGSTRPVTELRRWTAEVQRARAAYINRDAQLDAWQRNFEKRLEREGR